jgi:hypothetical protein
MPERKDHLVSSRPKITSSDTLLKELKVWRFNIVVVISLTL